MPNEKRGAKKTEEDLAFNAVIGRNIKYLRKYKKLNQTKVANHCKVKFQQLQKYEKGTNGCSAFRLHQLAKFFGVGMDVITDPQMIIKHQGYTSYQDNIDADIELDKLLAEQEIIDNYKKSEGVKKVEKAVKHLDKLIGDNGETKCP
jgi:transcriptional regulator with XRE-family HTH domain